MPSARRKAFAMTVELFDLRTRLMISSLSMIPFRMRRDGEKE